MRVIRAIHSLESPQLNPSLFIFKRCQLAAIHNARVLESFDYDLHRVILNQHPSQISYGSEFRHTAVLQELLLDHPLWPRLKNILDNGGSFPLQEISDQIRQMDLKFHQECRNHKSLLKHSEFIEPIITEDVERGFALPLPLEILHHLKGASIAALGCHRQSTIDEKGSSIPKYRLTHDQSFPGPSGLSVNLRVKKELLPPIMYSYLLSGIIHYIIMTRFRHPLTKIFLCKVDLDAAYRRCSMSSSTSLESLTIFEDILLVALRLTFGGSPCPNLWSVISEMILDIGNAILLNSSWDHFEFFDPLSNLIENPICLPENIPFAQAKDLSVNIPPNDNGYIDIYIDDNIGVTPDIGDNAMRLARAIPIAIKDFS